MKILIKAVVPLLVVAIGVLYIAIMKSRPSMHKETRFLMDTYCTIQAFGTRNKVDRAMTAAFDRMEEVDKKFNFLNPESPLYDFNTKNVPVSDSEIVEVMKIAQSISERSNGAFDLTIEPLLNLWGFYGETASLPEEEEIDKCMQIVGYKQLSLADGHVSKLKPEVRVDLGGIAKGYALREAFRVLKNEGIDSALIDAGGDIYVAGKIKGKYWNIGIRNPRAEGDMAAVQVSNLAVVTSGDYERFFMRDGRRYCHILNPRTGYPARGLISVTVISSDPIIADAWATALFVLGPEGMTFVEEIPNMEAMMVSADQQIILSSGLKESIVLNK